MKKKGSIIIDVMNPPQIEGLYKEIKLLPEIFSSDKKKPKGKKTKKQSKKPFIIEDNDFRTGLISEFVEAGNIAKSIVLSGNDKDNIRHKMAEQRACYLEAFALYQEIGIHRNKKSLQSRLQKLEKTFNQAKAKKNSDKMADAMLKMANINFEMEDYLSAKKRYLIVIDYAKKINDRNLLAVTSSNLGNCCLRLGELEDAEQNFIQALNIDENTPNLAGLIYDYHNLFILNRILAKKHEGKDYYFDKSIYYYLQYYYAKQGSIPPNTRVVAKRFFAEAQKDNFLGIRNMNGGLAVYVKNKNSDKFFLAHIDINCSDFSKFFETLGSGDLEFQIIPSHDNMSLIEDLEMIYQEKDNKDFYHGNMLLKLPKNLLEPRLVGGREYISRNDFEKWIKDPKTSVSILNSGSLPKLNVEIIDLRSEVILKNFLTNLVGFAKNFSGKITISKFSPKEKSLRSFIATKYGVSASNYIGVSEIREFDSLRNALIYKTDLYKDYGGSSKFHSNEESQVNISEYCSLTNINNEIIYPVFLREFRQKYYENYDIKNQLEANSKIYDLSLATLFDIFDSRDNLSLYAKMEACNNNFVLIKKEKEKIKIITEKLLSIIQPDKSQLVSFNNALSEMIELFHLSFSSDNDYIVSVISSVIINNDKESSTLSDTKDNIFSNNTDLENKLQIIWDNCLERIAKLGQIDTEIIPIF